MERAFLEHENLMPFFRETKWNVMHINIKFFPFKIFALIKSDFKEANLKLFVIK